MLNDYLIVDDSILEVDEYTGGAVAKFDRIQIAKSTMSMYVNMYDSSDIYHQTLAYLHDGIIELKPFYVAVPVSTKTLKFDRVQVAKKINNVEYDIYVVKDVPIYSSAMVTATALINKAVQMSLKYDAMIRGLESYMRFICFITVRCQKASLSKNCLIRKLAYEEANDLFKDLCRFHDVFRVKNYSRREIHSMRELRRFYVSVISS